MVIKGCKKLQNIIQTTTTTTTTTIIIIINLLLLYTLKWTMMEVVEQM